MPVDGRQSETALIVARGTMRLLLSHGFTCVSELPLPSGRRADLVAIGRSGEIWIVEIKSSIADFRADQKWMDYRMHCDRLFFATTIEVPCEIFPKDTGLIVADGFGGEIRLRGAGAPAAGADPQGDDASDRAMRGVAPAIADRSGRALSERDGVMSASIPFVPRKRGPESKSTGFPLSREMHGVRGLRGRYRGARFARIRCRVRRCMLSWRAVSETLRPHNS